MKKLIPFFMLSCLSLQAKERVTASIDAVYLTFYGSHDSLRLSCFENELNPSSTYSNVQLNNTTYDPTWGIQGLIGYQAEYCNLFSRLQGFFFKNHFRPRTQMYPGVGYANNYALALADNLFNDTAFVIQPTSTQIYQGDNPSNFDEGNFPNGVMVDGECHQAFNSLDLNIAPLFTLNKVIKIRPIFGFGGLISNFTNSYQLYVQQGSVPLNQTIDLLVQNQYETYQKFNGFGPETGFDFMIGITERFSLDLNATFRWLWGNKQTQTTEYYPFDFSGNQVNNSGVLYRDGTLCQSDYIFNAKLNAEFPLNQNKQHFGLSLGYRFEILPKFFTYAIDQTAAPDEGYDFMMQGLTAGAFYKF